MEPRATRIIRAKAEFEWANLCERTRFGNRCAGFPARLWSPRLHRRGEEGRERARTCGEGNPLFEAAAVWHRASTKRAPASCTTIPGTPFQRWRFTFLFKFCFAVVFCLFGSFPPLHSGGGIVDARSTSNGRRSARHRVWAGGKNRDGLGRCLGKAHAAASRETRAALAGAKLDPCETRPARFQLALLLVIYTCVVLFFRNAIHRYVLPIFFRSPLRCFVRF